MNWTEAALVFALGGTLVGWLALRLAKPEFERKFRAAFIAGAAAIGGALLAILTLGRRGRTSKPDEAPDNPPEKTPAKTLEETAEKYETEDNFDAFADTDPAVLDPAPPSSDLASELEDFRAGSGELLGDGGDPP